MTNASNTKERNIHKNAIPNHHKFKVVTSCTKLRKDISRKENKKIAIPIPNIMNNTILFFLVIILPTKFLIIS